MGGIIWFAIVLFIVIRAVNKSKAQQGQTKPNVPRKVQQHRPVQPQQRPVQQVQNRTSQVQRRTAQPPKKENSILQKAKENAKKQFEDDTLQARGSADLNRVPLGDEIMKDKAMARHIHSTHTDAHDAELHNRQGVDDFDTYHLLDEVNDLMIKGYSGNLEFERDFLSEATDMLNRMYG